MSKKENDSIEKLDAQIKKLKDREYDDTKTPLLNRNELKKSLEKKKNVEPKSNSRISSKTKTLKLDEIQKELNKKNTAAKKQTAVKKKTRSALSKTLIKNNYLSKKEKVNKVLDDETEVDKIIRFLTKFFTIFLAIFILIFLLICII